MSDRPNPLAKVAATVGGVVATLAGIVGTLVQLGVLNATQADAISAAGAAAEPTLNATGLLIGGLLPLISALVAAFSTVKIGKQDVTPVSSPMDNHGNVLIPSPGAHYAAHEKK